MNAQPRTTPSATGNDDDDDNEHRNDHGRECGCGGHFAAQGRQRSAVGDKGAAQRPSLRVQLEVEGRARYDTMDMR